MKVIIISILFIFSLCSSIINREKVEYLKKVAPFEVYNLEENKFRDWTDEEIKGMFSPDSPISNEMKMRQKTNSPKNRLQYSKNKDPQEADYDFRKAHPECVFGIRDQGKCNAGHTFAMAVALEQTSCLKKGYETFHYQLSPQYALSCNNKGVDCTGKNEDDIYYQTFIEHGIPTESCYPFSSQNGTVEKCEETCKDGSDWKLYDCAGSLWPTDVGAIKDALTTWGNLFCRMDLYEDFLNYKSGIYIQTSGEYLGKHSAVVMGYGYEDTKYYWIAQNSFGEEWGESGYFRIRFSEASIEEHCQVFLV